MDGVGESRDTLDGESLTVMEIMDKLRRDNDLRFPEEIETLDYPVPLPVKSASE
jgi:hypothetical protein